MKVINGNDEQDVSRVRLVHWSITSGIDNHTTTVASGTHRVPDVSDAEATRLTVLHVEATDARFDPRIDPQVSIDEIEESDDQD